MAYWMEQLLLGGFIYGMVAYGLIDGVMRPLWKWWIDRDRPNELRAVAAELDLDYKKYHYPWDELPQLLLHKQCGHQSVHHRMRGAWDGVPVYVYDFHRTCDGPEGTQTKYRETVIEFESGKLGLAGFTIRPKHAHHFLFDRFAKRKPIKTLDKRFDRRHRLFAHVVGEEEIVRKQVSAEVRQWVLARPKKLIVEGSDNRLLVWRKDWTIRPNMLQEEIDSVWSLFSKLWDAPLLFVDAEGFSR